jgi:uncharacterized RDD family membrane protein YckC
MEARQFHDAARGIVVTDSTSASLPAGRRAAGPPLYANFPRRLDALSIDSVVLIGFSILVFLLVPLFEHLDDARIALIVCWWLTIILYEPVMVWRFGGTIGHRTMNLRVVDNRTAGNVSLLKALARLIVKGLLGTLSFFTMNFSRRHQAVHDILTGSSVQIRNPSKAQPHHYTLGRAA